MKADLHMHTKYSPCSNTSIKDLLKTVYEKGLDTIAITDHNTIKGAKKVKKLAKKGLNVIIGCEKKCEFGELLIYNLKKEITSNSFKEIIKQARKQNAFIFISHPKDFIRFPNSWKNFSKEIISLIDGFETVNGRNVFNYLNKDLAKKFDKSFVAGSDAHIATEIGNTGLIYKKYLWKEVFNNKVKIFHNHSFLSKLISLTKGFITKRI